MSVANTLDRVTDWVRERICSRFNLKVPPDSDTEADAANYVYQRVKPAAFTLYVPTKDKLPPGIVSPIPSVCVRFAEGSESMTAGEGSISLLLYFSTWSTGTHGKDIVLPNPENALEPKRWTGEEADAYFRKNGDGWRDAWNMVDVALREIESVSNIDGLLIDRAVPVKFGPLAEQEAIPDFYPQWFAWVSFSVRYPVVRNFRDVEKFL